MICLVGLESNTRKIGIWHFKRSLYSNKWKRMRDYTVRRKKIVHLKYMAKYLKVLEKEIKNTQCKRLELTDLYKGRDHETKKILRFSTF